MAVIPTPEQGKPILDFSAGTFDGSSNLIQSRNGATEHVNGDDIADYVNTSRIYNTLETESKTPVGAINEIKAQEASDIADVQAAIDRSIMVFSNAGSHNSIYRGKYLGDEVTADQYAAIAAGTFDDMYIGDYWSINGVNWRIAHFDYWLNCGNIGSGTTTHHIVIVPDLALYSAEMNETNTTAGGYLHSKMRGGITYQDTFTGDGTTTVFTLSYSSSFVIKVKIGDTTQAISTYTISGTTLTFNTAPANGAAIEANYINTDYLNQGGLVQAKTMIEAAFGSAHILSHREMLSTASNSSGASNWGWADSTVDLISEVMAYGCKVWGNQGYDVGIDKEQLALFRHDVSRLTIRAGWWLRSVSSSSGFTRAADHGMPTTAPSFQSFGVRPAFALCS
jgi:hypothetical protein